MSHHKRVPIDLRSDTLTKPGEGMLKYMFNAEVGDMVMGEDPSVNMLEEYAANLFGTERALFCPSGTMTNQIAIKIHTSPGDEVICSKLAHIYQFEGGGIAFHSGASVALIDSENGLFTAEDVLLNINPDDVHKAKSSLISIENTVNKGGGAVWDLQEIKKIKSICTERGFAYHLDGARLFNALTKTGEKPSDYGSVFDTISICLSKGLGAPVGSLLLCSDEDYYKATRLRKVMGGLMRQAGYLAAAGLYALKNNVSRLTEDHENASTIAKALAECSWVESVKPVDSNIVVATCGSHIEPASLLRQLSDEGVLALSMGGKLIRFVTHLHISKEDASEAAKIIRALKV